MNNFNERELDLIIAVLNFADVNHEAFQKHLAEQGKTETAKFGSPLRLNNLRWRFSDLYHQELDEE